MNTQLNLKELELKAFRSTYQDGLWDMLFGLIVMGVSIFVYRPPSGYSILNILAVVVCMSVANGLFFLGKKFVTLPRMGQVQFGEKRKQRRRTMVIVLGIVILVQVILLAFQLAAWANPQLGNWVNEYLAGRDLMDLAVASIGALIVGVSMLLVAFFQDFPRGYYIAVLFSLAVFLMIYLNQPVYPMLIGALIAVPGLILFVRFLKKYPLHREETPHD